MKLKIKMLDGEHWWGGDIPSAEFMPFDKNTELTVLTGEGRTTVQCAPFFVSDKGRYIWSEKGFIAKFHKGVIKCCGEEEIISVSAGKTLREAFLAAKSAHFPFESKAKTARIFYEVCQFNTWVELIKEQTEEGILRYAEGLSQNGYTKGILMIDDGWQREHGTWKFDSDKFSDPKGMIERLHSMGFKIMLWISPYVSLSSDNFLELARERGIETDTGHLTRLKDGRVAIHKWWNGYCAMLDLTKEGDREYLKGQLDTLVNEYGVDGFKFDGGDYTWSPINEVDTFSQKGKLGGASDTGSFKGAADPMRYGWRLSPLVPTGVDELNAAWVKFGMQYELHEFKNTFKTGHLPVISRLHDKLHRWDMDGIASLVPHGIFLGLIGNPFICPDMVGGGSWTDFAYGKIDEELFVRMAEASALFPMMQFSGAPWRLLSKENADICLKMARLHESMSAYIISLVEKAEKTGEPIMRNLEYQFPGEELYSVNDQFMLGEKYLVAPVLEKGAVKRTVAFPSGKWRNMNTGEITEGGVRMEVDAPIDVLPYFEYLG